MGKMQVLGVVAVLLAVYCVHANVYFREEFSDGGKFGIEMYNARLHEVNVESLNASLTVSRNFCYKYHLELIFEVCSFRECIVQSGIQCLICRISVV